MTAFAIHYALHLGANSKSEAKAMALYKFRSLDASHERATRKYTASNMRKSEWNILLELQ